MLSPCLEMDCWGGCKMGLKIAGSSQQSELTVKKHLSVSHIPLQHQITKKLCIYLGVPGLCICVLNSTALEYGTGQSHYP